MNNDKKQNINTSLCWDTFFEKSRGPRAEGVLKCWNQSFSGNDERVANASTCSNIYTNGITRSDEEWCWWLTVAQIQSFLRPPHPPSANSCSYSPLLEYHQHQPFDTMGIIVTVIKNSCRQSSARKLSQQGERMSTITLQWWLHYLPVSHCISPPSQLCLLLWTCALRIFLLQKIVCGLVLWFEVPKPNILFDFGFTFEEVFQPCFNRLLLWRQRCKIILQISPPHSVGLQVLPSFTRHDTLSIKLKALNPRRKTLNTGLILQVKHIYIMAFLCRGFPYLLLSFKLVRDFTFLQKIDPKSYQ